MAKVKYPDGYKKSDVSLDTTKDGVRKVYMKDGKVFAEATDQPGVFTEWVEPNLSDANANADASGNDKSLSVDSVVDPATGQATANVTDLTQPSGDNNKLIPELQAKVVEQQAVTDEQAKRIAELEAENARLKVGGGAVKGDNEGKRVARRHMDDVSTQRPRMAGKYPHSTDEMPTVDEINGKGG